MPEHTMGELARSLLDMQSGAELPNDSYIHLMSCSLCGLCTVGCPVDLDCASLVRAGRAVLMQEYRELADHYRPYRVDLPDNYFNDLRQAEGIIYDEGLNNPGSGGKIATGATAAPGAAPGATATATAAPGAAIATAAATRMFMPGCTLSCFSESITNEVFGILKRHSLADAMTLRCCGNPLNSAGYGRQFLDYTSSLNEMLTANGVQQVIAACPNCYRSLKDTLQRDGLTVDVLALPQVLADAGIRYDPGTADPGYSFGCISVHDSCPDRNKQVFAKAVRTIFSACEIREMGHYGQDAICCGSGGLSGLNSPDIALARCKRRYQEFLDTQADCMVAFCAACSNSFLRVQQDKPVQHYLELLCGKGFDWQRVGSAMNSMQQG